MAKLLYHDVPSVQPRKSPCLHRVKYPVHDKTKNTCRYGSLRLEFTNFVSVKYVIMLAMLAEWQLGYFVISLTTAQWTNMPMSSWLMNTACHVELSSMAYPVLQHSIQGIPFMAEDACHAVKNTHMLYSHNTLKTENCHYHFKWMRLQYMSDSSAASSIKPWDNMSVPWVCMFFSCLYLAHMHPKHVHFKPVTT